MDPKPILYSYWRSSCSYRVRIGLNLKGIDYEYHSIDLAPSQCQQKLPTYEELNPLKQVPALLFTRNGKQHSLIQSVAILEFLEESYPQGTPLLPKDPLERAHVRIIVETVAGGIQPLQNPETLKMGSKSEEEMNQFANEIIAKKFVALEMMLNKYSGEFCVGNQLSLADLFVVPQVYNARRYKVDLTPFPTIVRLSTKLEQLPAFFKASPNQQPDCPPHHRNA